MSCQLPTASKNVGAIKIAIFQTDITQMRSFWVHIRCTEDSSKIVFKKLVHSLTIYGRIRKFRWSYPTTEAPHAFNTLKSKRKKLLSSFICSSADYRWSILMHTPMHWELTISSSKTTAFCWVGSYWLMEPDARSGGIKLFVNQALKHFHGICYPPFMQYIVKRHSKF